MGFLDFLKKQPPKPEAPTPLERPVATAPAPTLVGHDPVSPDTILRDLTRGDVEDKDMGPPKVDPFGLEAIAGDFDPAKQAAAPLTKEEMAPAQPIDLDEIKRKLGIQEDEFGMPVGQATPPPPAPSPLAATVTPATPIAPPPPPPKPLTPLAPTLLPPPPPAPVQKQEAPKAPAKKAAPEIPDFSDEDIAALERSIAKQKPVAPPPAKLPVEEPAKPTATPMLPAPKPAPVVKEFLPPPPGESPSLHGLEHAMFLSAGDYLAIREDIRALRRGLRRNDDVLREAQLRHEQADAELSRAAADADALQERLMALDRALFEQ